MSDTKRLVYIDCLRGVAMLMVVYSHVLTFCMDNIQPSPLGQLMRDLMLPLFFFISGFCAWSDKTFNFTSQFINKVKQILIPTIVMFLTFMLYTDNDITDFASRYDKCGYWFTWVLFQIFVIYLPTRYITCKFHNTWIRILILLLPILLMTVIFQFVGLESRIAIFFEWVKVKEFYVIFTAGVCFKIFKTLIYNWLKEPLINAGLIVISFFSYKYAYVGGYNALIMCTLSFCIFRCIFQFNESPNSFSKILSRIGQNSLAIYFLHFFMLFRIPQTIVDYVISLRSDTCFGTNSCCSLVEFLVCMSISLLICVFCLIIQKVLKCFPIIYSISLGK